MYPFIYLCNVNRKGVRLYDYRQDNCLYGKLNKIFHIILNILTFHSLIKHMAYPSLQLIEALRETANRLRHGAHYAWGHHGACNCGNLLQVLTPLDEKEILNFAHTGAGEWTELAEEYCSASNAPVNLVLSKLMEAGLTPSDVHHIEYLTDRAVLEKLPGGLRWLKRNVREDVILYFEAFANLLEEQLLESIDIAELTNITIAKIVV